MVTESSRVLRTGSRGDDVKKLQEALGIKADGAFGIKTAAMLMQWQKLNGLIPDGIAVPVSLNTLLGQ